jgi:hypothetical protein
MVDAETRHGRHRVRHILLVPAVVVGLITAAVPAGASRVTGPMGIANAARTAVVAKGHARPCSRHAYRQRSALGRKVG